MAKEHSKQRPKVEVHKATSTLGQFLPPRETFSRGRNPLEEIFRPGVVKECHTPKFLSRVFTVPKANGKEKLILDLSRLNTLLQAPNTAFI